MSLSQSVAQLDWGWSGQKHWEEVSHAGAKVPICCQLDWSPAARNRCCLFVSACVTALVWWCNEDQTKPKPEVATCFVTWFIHLLLPEVAAAGVGAAVLVKIDLEKIFYIAQALSYWYYQLCIVGNLWAYSKAPIWEYEYIWTMLN